MIPSKAIHTHHGWLGTKILSAKSVTDLSNVNCVGRRTFAHNAPISEYRNRLEAKYLPSGAI